MQSIKGKTKDRPVQDQHLFITQDRWGNTVHCTRENWISHIIVAHPELAGREKDVITTIESPDRIVSSTKTGMAFGHEKNIDAETVRAITYYDDPKVLKTGQTTGQLGTAYIVDILNYRSRVGAPIYVKGSEDEEGDGQA